MRETEFFPVQNKEAKLQVEATPGFSPSMYQFINGKVDGRGLAKFVRSRELRPKREAK